MVFSCLDRPKVRRYGENDSGATIASVDRAETDPQRSKSENDDASRNAGPQRPLLLRPRSSTTAASRRPGAPSALPKSKLSRRIALLEERLGVRLIQRSTRRFAVTEMGQTYYAHCKAMLVEAQMRPQEAIELTRAEPCGIVRMTCPVALLERARRHDAGDVLVRLSARRNPPRGDQPARRRRSRSGRRRDSGAPAATRRQRSRRCARWATAASAWLRAPRCCSACGTPKVPADLDDVAEPRSRHCRTTITSGTCMGPDGAQACDPPSTAFCHRRHAGATRRGGGRSRRRPIADDDDAATETRARRPSTGLYARLGAAPRDHPRGVCIAARTAAVGARADRLSGRGVSAAR